MVKYPGPIIIACLYLLFSGWLVGSVGKAHRQSLQRSSPRPPEPPVGAPSGSSPEVSIRPEPPPAKPDVTGMTPRKTEDKHPVPPPTTPPAPREPEKPSGPTTVVIAGPAAGGKPAPRTEPAAPKEMGAKAPSLDLGKIDKFFDSPAATKKWDFSNWTVDKERELGRELNDMVMWFNRKSTNGALKRRVLDAADPILEARTRKALKYDFFVLDSDAINAFSHPGGYVYVTRGLLDWISEDEDEALQFALAHEIFHVDCGHALVCLQDANVRKLPFGTLTIFYLLFFPRAYPDAMEFAADDWALKQLRRLGCTRRTSLKFINKLDHYAEDHDFLEGRQFPEPTRAFSLFDNHYRAHPSSRDRAKRLLAQFDGGLQEKK
ncbi:MAG: M48 family metalloprotease [Isosphaeraceae bacterium]